MTILYHNCTFLQYQFFALCAFLQNNIFIFCAFLQYYVLQAKGTVKELTFIYINMPRLSF